MEKILSKLENSAQEKGFFIVDEILKDTEIKQFIAANFQLSFKNIGFSDFFIEEFNKLLDSPAKYKQFIKTHEEELHIIDDTRFFGQYVPEYFSKYVTPEIPACKKVVDIGCGPGLLARMLAARENIGAVIGIDVISYPNWSENKNKKIEFKIVNPEQFIEFLNAEQPDVVTLTWSLHYMNETEQDDYPKILGSVLKPEARVVVLEDAYSIGLKPEEQPKIHDEFTNFEEDERKKIMAVYDWFAGRVLARRETMPIVFGYRGLEDWENLFLQNGFKLVSKRYIGFPEHRDINTPQSLLVVEKV